MARERHCRVCGNWHKVDEWPLECYKPRKVARSGLSAPMINADTMEPVQSQLDGKMYDSKSELRATYKAAGMVEVGNDSSVTDPKPRPKPKPDRKKIKASVHKAFSQVGLGA